MITVFNSFLTYLILVIASLAIIVCAIVLGKKIRDYMDNKNAKKAALEGDNE